MILSGAIGRDPNTYEGIDGAEFANELYSLCEYGAKKIKIVINSWGGSVIDGMSIFDAILNVGCQVDTYNAGVACSIAAVIFQAGAVRYMSDYSTLMFHDPYNSDGSIDEGLEMMKKALVKMISQRSDKPEQEVAAIMARETWLFADEACKTGFADEEIPSSSLNKKKVANVQDAKAKARGCRAILNQFINTQDNTMGKTTKVTKLDPKIIDAYKQIKSEDKKIEAKNETQEEIIEEIEELQEELQEAGGDIVDAVEDQVEAKVEADVEDKAEVKADEDVTAENYNPTEATGLPDWENAIKNADAEILSLRAELKDMKDKLEALNAAKVESEATAKADKIQNMLNGFVKVGKIKDDATTISKWTKVAEDNYDLAVDLISDMQVSKTAMKFNVTPTKEDIAQQARDKAKAKNAAVASGTEKIAAKDFMAKKLYDINNKLKQS